MLDIKPYYVTDAGNNKIAVQLSMESYKKIEEVLENYSLYKLMETKASEKPLEMKAAVSFYKKLKKAR